MRREWLETDYYAVLGVPHDASEKDIKRAYRKLAQKYHPDANSEDPKAEERFKEITEAYAVLGDREQRRQYDQAREAMAQGMFVGGPGGGQQYVRMEDLGDLFGGLFGGGVTDLFGRTRTRQTQGRDYTTDVTLTFHEAISGTTRELTVDGKPVKVRIPQGIDDKARIRLSGKGGPGAGGGPPGDLYIEVHVTDHPVFGRSGRNLTITVPITYAEASLGAEIDVPTLKGKVRVRVPPGTASGTTLRVRGKGVTGADGSAGDLLVTVKVDVPTEPTAAERRILESLRTEQSKRNPRSHLGV